MVPLMLPSAQGSEALSTLCGNCPSRCWQLLGQWVDLAGVWAQSGGGGRSHEPLVVQLSSLVEVLEPLGGHTGSAHQTRRRWPPRGEWWRTK